MTLFELRRLCRLWQKRLRITDWRITVKFSEAEGNLGITDYNPRELIATIEIRPGQTEERYHDGGTEQTLIHELLHVVLDGEKEYGGEDLGQERSINRIADALYTAYRGRKR